MFIVNLLNHSEVRYVSGGSCVCMCGISMFRSVSFSSTPEVVGTGIYTNKVVSDYEACSVLCKRMNMLEIANIFPIKKLLSPKEYYLVVTYVCQETSMMQQ